MVYTIKTSVLAFCLMMATSSMGTPVNSVPSPVGAVPGPVITYRPDIDTIVDVAGNVLRCIIMAASSIITPVDSVTSPVDAVPGPVITYRPGIDTVVDTAGNLLRCTMSSPNPDTSCGNAGLAYAVQKHDFYNGDAPKYSNASVEFFKTATPIQTGVTKKIGFTGADPAKKYSIYGGALINVDMIAVNHRGYFVPQTTGEYTISSESVDDLVIVWIGDNAYNGKYTRPNANFEQGYNPGTQSYRIILLAGRWYPFRVLFIAAQSATNLAITVTAPDGSILISPTSTDAPYFVQYDCANPSTKFQEFGKETA